MQYHMVAVKLRALHTPPFFYTTNNIVQATYRPLCRPL